MDARVKEFHCIMPLANLPSVLKLGILSYERAAKIDHSSTAMIEVQDRRDKKRVPGGLRLHQYANLYFHARNPMLFKRRADSTKLCVLRVSLEVIDLEGVVITDRNAASDWVRFLHPRQSHLLNFDAIFAMDWRHPNDEIAYYRHRSEKCAEVLVPHVVEPRFLLGAYVVDNDVCKEFRGLCALPVIVEGSMFFQ
jgi:hypothetical protein